MFVMEILQEIVICFSFDMKRTFTSFYVPGSDSGDILFLPCLFVGLFVGWTTLTLVITFETFEIEPLYLACRFLVTRTSHSYKKF